MGYSRTHLGQILNANPLSEETLQNLYVKNLVLYSNQGDMTDIDWGTRNHDVAMLTLGRHGPPVSDKSGIDRISMRRKSSSTPSTVSYSTGHCVSQHGPWY
jgi:hypothetical protein